MSLYREQAPVLATAAAVVGAGALWCAAHWTARGRRRPVLALAGAIATGWIAAIIAIPLRPYTHDPQPRTIHWVPFSTGSDPMEVLSNIALFIPLGVVVALVLSEHRQHWLGLLWRAGAVGAGCSTLIEVAQLVQAGGRITETTDILTNTTGTLTGALITTAVLGWATTRDRHPRARPAGQDQQHQPN